MQRHQVALPHICMTSLLACVPIRSSSLSFFTFSFVHETRLFSPEGRCHKRLVYVNKLPKLSKYFSRIE